MWREQLIVVSGVHKRFGRKRVLWVLILCVEQGQVMALLGANGAGKSTLMRIISGLSQTGPRRCRIGRGFAAQDRP